MPLRFCLDCRYAIVLVLVWPVVSSASGLDAQRIVARKSLELMPQALADYLGEHVDELQERVVEPDIAWASDESMWTCLIRSSMKAPSSSKRGPKPWPLLKGLNSVTFRCTPKEQSG